ncbi:hypothetical protein AB0E01_32815, partial [Nocardia vinacea]
MTGHRSVAIAIAIAAVAVSVGSVVQVYRIGDSGAQAAWYDRGAGLLTTQLQMERGSGAGDDEGAVGGVEDGLADRAEGHAGE